MDQRQKLIGWVTEAMTQGCRLSLACQEVNVSAQMIRCWQQTGGVAADRCSTCERKAPANRLSEAEQHAILAVCNAPEYFHLTHSQIVCQRRWIKINILRQSRRFIVC